MKTFRVLPLTAGRVAKKQRKEDAQQLQKAAVQLLNQHQNLPNLLLEVGVSDHRLYPSLCIIHPRESEVQTRPVGLAVH